MSHITLKLTREEAALIAPVLAQLPGLEPRTRLVATRVAWRISELLGGGDPLVLRDRFLSIRTARDRSGECPTHNRSLRLDRDTVGKLLEIYYCPTYGCSYTVEVGK